MINTTQTVTVNRIEIERRMRAYLSGEFCGFPFLLFSRITGIPYADVLRVSDQFWPYSKVEQLQECIAIANDWPSGVLSSLGAVCTMEGCRRKGVAI